MTYPILSTVTQQTVIYEVNIMKLNREDLLSAYESKIDEVEQLADSIDQLPARNQSFAADLINQFSNTGSLSPNQSGWVTKLLNRVKSAEPIYGDFNAIRVMFRLAAANGGLKFPKIRLMSKGGRFVQLNFDAEGAEKTKVFVDGWQGHGHRKYAGEISENTLKPWDGKFGAPMLENDGDVRLLLQEFALDPVKVAKASAAKLGCCSFCGQRLSDDRSKEAGYGPTCAKNYGLPWGGKSYKEAA